MGRKNIILLFCFFQLLYSGSSTCHAQKTRLDSLEDKLKNSRVDTLQAELLIELANNYRLIDTSKALVYANRALKLSKDLNYPKGIAGAYFQFGEMAEDDGKYGQAIIYLNRALKSYAQINAQKEIAQCYNKIGDVYWWLADYQHAQENYFEALKINEKRQNKIGMATCYRNIGWVYYRQDNFQKALEFFTKALKIFEEEGGKAEHLVMMYSDLGAVHGSLKNHNSSLEFFLKSLELSKDSKPSTIAIIYDNLAIAYSNLEQTKLAKEYVRKAEKIFTEMNQKVRMVEVYNTFADIYYEEGMHDSALYYAKKSLAISQENKFTLETKNVWFLLQKIYSAQEKYREAFNAFKNYSRLRDSIFSEENTRQVSELQFLYESGKKEQQIELQNLQIEKQESDIKRQRILLFSSVAVTLIFLVMSFFIWREYRAKKKANDELALQKAIVDQKNKDMTDSINYAQRIQEAILPDIEIKYRIFPNAFVYLRPRDIVSGDFYWYAEKDGKKFIAAVDCTGHGVPGAFMSIIGNHLLNEIILERSVLQPSEVLNQLHEGVRSALKQDDQKKQADGMDIALISFSNAKAEYAGASRPLYIVSGEALQEIKPDKFPIGGKDAHEGKKFTNHSFEIKKGDMIYISSDGYADQFGGEMGKKFMTKNFKNLLLSIAHEAPSEQERILDSTFEKWKGTREQVDDVLVIGIKV